MITPTSGAPRAVETDAAPPSYGYRSQAVVASGYLFTGGQIGVRHHRGPDADATAVPDRPLEEQLDLCLRHLDAITVAAGGTRDRVVEVSAFVVDDGSLPLVQRVVDRFLGVRPPILGYRDVQDVAFHGRVELDWIACLEPDLEVAEAAEVIRPLGDLGTGAEVVRSGPFLITNGVLGSGADMTAAAQSAVNEIATRLGSAGARLEDLVKLVVYIDEFDDYPAFDRVTRDMFVGDPLPTRSVIVAPEVTGSARVRVDVLAQR
jgi:enamine deaminase RidA (YjgF/YER057c/UK114 family)